MAAAVATRYARAFADVVAARKMDPAQALAQVESVARLTAGSPELREVWGSPSVPHDQKLKLLDAIAQRAGLSREARNFVAIIIDHRRVRGLDDIARALKQELTERAGFTEAQVTSSRPLSKEERRMMEQQIERVTGKRVRAEYKEDRGLLGGAVVRVGSTIYDGSVRGQLASLREQLAGE